MRKFRMSLATACMMMLMVGAKAVGVIGGADGPTVIMVSSVGGWWEIGIIAALILALIAGIVLWIRRKNR